MMDDSRARLLIGLGALLFLVGLLTGAAIPTFRNPRLGLSSHLEGVMNGTFLMVLGAVWHRVDLPRVAARLCVALLVYGAFANWLTTLAAATFGAGRMTPIAAGGMTAEPWQEALVAFGLFSLSVAMVVGSCLLVWGLFRRG